MRSHCLCTLLLSSTGVSTPPLSHPDTGIRKSRSDEWSCRRLPYCWVWECLKTARPPSCPHFFRRFFFFFYSEQMRAICSVMFGSICTIQSCCLQVGQWHGLARLVWRMRSWIPLGPITGSDSDIWEGLVAHFLFLELILFHLAKRGFTHNIWKNQKHHSDCTHWSGRRRKCYCERSLSVSLPEGSLIP